MLIDASLRLQVLSSDIDLLHPPAELEKQKHKLKRLVQSPNSFFMDVKCAGCFQMCAPRQSFADECSSGSHQTLKITTVLC